MATEREINHEFKLVTNGAPPKVLAELGAAILAVRDQRTGKGTEAAAKLRQAWLALARHIIRQVPQGLNPHQQLFLLAGALAPAVTVKSPNGEQVTVELLPAETYQALLDTLIKHGGGAGFILEPRRRMTALASGDLAPLDLDKPGRYRPPDAAQQTTQVRQSRATKRLQDASADLSRAVEELDLASRRFTDSIKSEKLSAVVKGLNEIKEIAKWALSLRTKPHELATWKSPKDAGSHPVMAAFKNVSDEITSSLGELVKAQRNTLDAVLGMHAIAKAMTRLDTPDKGSTEEVVLAVAPKQVRQVAADYDSVNGVMVQLLNNDPQRTSWSTSRVLLTEHTGKNDDPLQNCYATPENLAASIEKIDALHPNCFPHDTLGRPILPPVVIEPGVGLVKWYDDRFLMSFVCSETPRKGRQLSLGPVDLAVLQLYALFTARGEMYDYRGDRVSGNFIADYAGDVQQKAKVKFTGERKKITYTTATEVHDAASREDAVQDYIDFIFCVFNSLPLPKRITSRKAGVILKYCIIENATKTAALAMRLVAAYDNKLVREILVSLTGRDGARTVGLIREALEADPQLNSRYQDQFGKAVKDIMGAEFYRNAEKSGLLTKVAVPVEERTGAQKEPATSHDYFDV